MKHILLLSSLLGSFMGQQHLLVEGSSSSTLPKSLASLHHLHPDVFRGGGTAVAEKNKTNKKKKKKKRKLKSLKTVTETETVTEFETVTEDEDTAELPTVESILIDRRVNIRKVISSLSLGCAMLCLMTGCIPTAGNPYRHAVWEALHEGNMPTDYLPTVLDVLLTKHKVSLPPQYLPSPAPLLSLLASLAVFIGVAILLPKWSLPVKLFFHYVQTDADHLDQLDDMDTASVLIKVPKDQRIFSQGKSRIISPLFREQKGGQHFFHLNHVRYYWDGQQVTHGGPTIHKWAIASILGWKGLNSMSKIKEAKQKYAPYNSIISELPCPTIRQALATRLSSPLAVFQFASKMLQIVEGDSSLFHSMGSIFATLGQHYWNARQTITSAKELATEVTAQIQDTAQLQVFCQRERKKGKFISAIDLLPGDIFYLEKQTITTMPVDAVLLDGTCIAMEAVLTGESVPQSKMCLQNSTTEEHFDMNGEHRSSVLFAGTTVQLGGKIKCLAIKTGSYSSRGDIWRVLQKSQKVGAISNPQVERDGVKLLLALTAACIMSCAWFLSNASEDTSNFRKVLQCTRIASSSIPSDLPLALSSVAQSCAARLKADGEVVCGEPGSLLTAASVDCVVFDKTGTLTADTQSMSQIVSYQNSQKKTARIVLAGCHALVRSTQADERWIGDPLDSASFLFSGWRYDKKDGSFCDKQQRRLWQLKTFPFDANRKLSSALVLVQQGKEYSLMYVVKGSSETVQRNFLRRKNRKFQTWYQGQLTELGKDGVRTVAMVAKTLEVTNSSLCEALLPTGAEQNITAHLRKAKKLAKKLVSRDDIESDSATGWKFCGFACFDATVRPSTPRIIRELQTANIQTMMLTGDGVDAAISVAKRSNILPQTKTVATLDCDDQGELVWKEDGRKTTCSSGSVLRDRSLSLAMTGNAAEKLLAGRHSDENARYILSKIHKIVVFARCSPKQKKMIVGALREYGKKKVLMCGDGVNDVAAMKVADCGLALLNGYGVESMSKSNSDVENERRLQKIGQRRIGSNRRRNKQLDANTLAGIGNTRKANSLRLGAEMEAALLEIRKKAAARQGISDPDQAELSLGDIKAHFAAIWALNKKERLRATLLRKGGAGAARVLAEDDMKRNDTDDNGGASEIRTGEASLVSSFSCLRPAIDGVDALLRTGASASASTMATMKNIGLQSLMNCYNLASLYKNGFRYGKHMWSVESAIYMSISQASCSSSFSPRPRLSGVLAEMSLFHPANAMSAFAQAFIHLATLTVGVRMGNYLEKLETPETKSLKRKIKTIDRAANTNPLITETLVKALLEAPVVAAGEEEVEKKEKGFFGIFYRPPFKPNYTTNFVFLMSIFQYAVSELVNHRGKPFYGSILESRQLTASIGMSILFPVLMLLDAFPVFSDMLELKKMPSKKAKASVLLIFLLDLIGCLVSSKLASSLLEAPAKTDPKSSKNVSSKQCAADEEEKILAEESKANAVFASVLLMSGMYFVVKNILL